MKTYGNGPRGMRYGGMTRKPMMYGGGVSAGIKSFKNKKPKKKQMGGMINNTMSTGMNKMPNPMIGKTMMAGGGKLPMTTVKGKKVPFFAADGKGKNDLA